MGRRQSVVGLAVAIGALVVYLASQSLLVRAFNNSLVPAMALAVVAVAPFVLYGRGWRSPSVTRPLPLALWTLAALVLVWFASQAASVSLAEAFPPTRPSPDVAGTAAGFLVVVVAAPFAEELLCRHLLHRRLQRLVGRPASLLVSSSVFAVLHGQPARVVPMLLLGLLLGTAFDAWGGSLPVAWAVHSLFNLAAVLIPVAVVAPFARPAAAVVLAVAAVALLASPPGGPATTTVTDAGSGKERLRLARRVPPEPSGRPED